MRRPGRHEARVVGAWSGRAAAVLGAGAGALVGVLTAEAKLARRTIGEPTEAPPDPTGTYGRYPGTPCNLTVLGDSGAAGLGCEHASQTPGALLAGSLARDLRRRVALQVVAVVGARSADLDAQVAHALERRVDVAFVMVGTNDVTHRVPPGRAAHDLGRAVARLREAGAAVVVGTCPDLGTIRPVLQPLRTYGSVMSRRTAAAQTVAVVEAGGVTVSLGALLTDAFSRHEHLWSADRFHPSASGYRRVADAVYPSLLQAAGATLGAEQAGTSTVQDVEVAAAAASREAGLVVETVPGADGAGGAGRLARLVRRPLRRDDRPRDVGPID